MSLIDDYYRKCATCERYGLLNSTSCNSTGFKCYRFEKYYPLDENCTHYSRNRNVKDRDIIDAMKIIESKKNSWWYVTTAILSILNLKSYDYYLSTLSKIRDEYLLKHLDKMWILVKYDMLGRELANKLYESEYSVDICKYLTQQYLSSILLLIEEEKYEEATILYFQMINELEEKFIIQNYYHFKIQTDEYGRKLIQK